MTFAEMIALNCDRLGLSRQEFADRCGLPSELLLYVEDPKRVEKQLIAKCAEALNIKIAVFTGEEKPEPTYEEQLEASLTSARYPGIRKFFINSCRCSEPKKTLALFGTENVSIVEKNLILHLSTSALYHFCDTNSSRFRFDEYLFKLHSPLFSKYEQKVKKSGLSKQEQNDRIDNARKNVFSCDSMENIAIRIAEPFAEELEEKLQNGNDDFGDELEFPLQWDFDDELMKLRVLGADGSCTSEIKLLSVREREIEDSPQAAR